MTRVEPTREFPYRWETVIPEKPCPDAGCTRTHGGSIMVGADAPVGEKDGYFMLGIVSDLGEGALRLTPQEAFALMDDIQVALGVMIGVDASDAIRFIADLESGMRKVFDAFEREEAGK